MKPIKMAYKVFEGGTIKSDVPVIIMHGLFGSKINWSSLGVRIQKRASRIVYAVDARNHGDSPHTDEHTYIHLAEDIKLFASDIKAKKAAFIGHSMGGRAVMVLALRYPQIVESLTVIDISPIDTVEPMRGVGEIIKAMKAVTFKDGGTTSEARRVAQNQLEKSLGSSELASFLTMNVVEKQPGKFSWKVNLNAISNSYEAHMVKFPLKTGQFKGPTLFVIGGQSNFVNVDDTDKIKEQFPRSSFEVIEDAGHLLHMEKPKLFAGIVCDFINKNAEQK